MYSISFDLDVDVAAATHPKGFRQACRDIEKILSGFSFRRIQQSVYLTEQPGLANTFQAVEALKALHRFPAAVIDIRVFRVEDWSDFTQAIKAARP